jgi:hypothetical protein
VRDLIPPENARSDVLRALVLAEVFGTPYSETPLYALERALAESGGEYQLAEVTVGNAVGAIALYGAVAGTIGTARLYLVAPTGGPDRAHVSRALESAIAQLKRDGVRLLIAELPDEKCMAGMRKLLLECGFREESRVADLFRDGVALTFLRRDLR